MFDFHSVFNLVIRKRLFAKLEQDQKISLQNLAEECQRILNLRADTAKIEERDISNIPAIKKKLQGKKNKPYFKINPCYGCGELNLFKDCPFKHKKCFACGFKGHKFSHCRRKVKTKTKKNLVKYTTEHATIEKVQRKYTQIRLNKKKKDFLIDTGADLTIINAETWTKIKCPTLLNSKKIARGIAGEKLEFMGDIFINVFFNGKKKEN